MFEKKYSMTQEENVFWAKRNLVDYIWKSANLEGIGVTFPETQTIVEGISVQGKRIDDINSIVQLKHGWQMVFDTIDAPLDLAYIKKLHLIIGRMTVINSGSPFATDLKTIYQAPDEKKALAALDRVTEKWTPKYPNSMKRWKDNWDAISPIFKFSAAVRKVIYTTNAIESLNSTYRRLNQQRSVFPSDTALLKALYLATFEATKRWTTTIRNWGQVYGELSIMYEQAAGLKIFRLTKAEKPPVIDMPSARWYI